MAIPPSSNVVPIRVSKQPARSRAASNPDSPENSRFLPISLGGGGATRSAAESHNGIHSPDESRLISSLRDEEEWFEANFRLAIIGMKILSLDLRYRSANPALCRFVGYTEEELLNLTLTDLIFPEDHGWIRRSFQQLLDGEVPFLQFERRFRHKDGHQVWGLANNILVRDADGTARYIIGQIMDVTKRKQVEDELRAREEVLQYTQERMRALASYLLRSGEKVQRNLARELHDGLAQGLASAGFRLSGLKKSLSIPDPARRELSSIVREIQGLAYTIHDLSHRLHPAILDELGLVAALEKECRAFSRQGKVNVRFVHGKLPKALPPDHSLCLYRIAQESFRNISKHAGARNVKVSLDSDPSGVRLVIEDDGRGVSHVARRVKKGLGLISMEERASLAGGAFSIRPRRPRGTHVEVQVPWKGRNQ